MSIIKIMDSKSEILTINSFDRDISYGGSTTSNFRINFNVPKTGIKSMSLVSCIIPATWYNVFDFTIQGQHFYNTMITLYEVLGGLSVTFALTPGNYTISTFLTELATALTTNSPNAETYTVTYDSSTFKISIVGTGITQFALNFANAASLDHQPSYLMGFDYNTNSSTSVADVLISPNAINLGQPLYASIKFQNLAAHCYNTSGQSASFNVPLSVNGNNIVYFTDMYSTQNTFELSPTTQPVGYLNIALVNDYLDILSLNGAEWSFSVKIEYY